MSTLYLYRHIQTSQVLVSLRQGMKNKVLQQQSIKQRPPRLRKDHWVPMLAISGFDKAETAQALHDSILTRSQQKQNSKINATISGQPARLREPLEREQIQQTLEALQEALTHTLPKRSTEPLRFHWENKALSERLQWPEHVQHGDLQLVRGRIPVQASSS
ncbi:hypothetical protein BZG36_03299 [Bifiguratus adelaidae]|uniref:Large ribosomal subunit protein mL67 n=1 Tax=Bifiguratus adelaidae TaxID=1938954 RepID=A0A261XZF3_9FUNG|nr:hypothetical protein BZG36_03299 [Bifiguratus adelaidae]